MQPAPRLCTVGHGARPVAALITLLREASVTRVVDVRRFPGSRRHPQFGRAQLTDALTAASIAYEWAGETLGGRRSRAAHSRHTSLQQAAFAGYADHMDSLEFREAVSQLLIQGVDEQLAIMCAETLWWRCHRMLIADALTMRGAEVIHLLEPGRWQRHRPHPAVRQGDDGWPVYDVSGTLPGM